MSRIWKNEAHFADRRAAGRQLARALLALHPVDPVVLALPRGGVAVGAEIAKALEAPMDLVLVRKIGVPRHPELAAAAVVDGGVPEVVRNEDVIEEAGVTAAELEAGARSELAELERRRSVYLQGRERTLLENRTVIVVDDGIATGATVRAALRALRRKHPRRLVLAVPVAPRETLDELAAEVDQVVCLQTPDPFIAIGLHYADFHQMNDDEVVALLARSPASAEAGHFAKNKAERSR